MRIRKSRRLYASQSTTAMGTFKRLSKWLVLSVTIWLTILNGLSMVAGVVDLGVELNHLGSNHTDYVFNNLWIGDHEHHGTKSQNSVGNWTATDNMMWVPRCGHSATLLANGKVLVAGGWNANDRELSSAELYDPSVGLNGAWSLL